MKIENYSVIAKYLKIEFPKLSEFKILSLAIQIERNQILQKGLVVSSDDKHPVGLEAIAITLGYKGGHYNNTITDVLSEINHKLDSDFK